MNNYEYFLSLDTRQYEGKWIAIYKEKVIASGKRSSDVIKKALKISEKPFIVKIPSKETDYIYFSQR